MVHIVQIHESFGSGTLAIVADIVRKTHELNWKTTIFHGMRAETPDNFRELFPAGTIFKVSAKVAPSDLRACGGVLAP